MDLIEYEKIVKSEAAARRYLLRFCREEGGRSCPRCREKRVYELADKRLRCSGCRYTFHDFTGRWINFSNLTSRDWLRLIKLFELELTINRMVPQLKLSYNTVYKAVTILRFSILAQALDAVQLLTGPDLGFENGRISMGRAPARAGSFPVFGIMEKNDWAFVDLLPHLQAENVFHFNLNFQLAMARMGNIAYTDGYQRYDALVFCGDESLPFGYIQSGERSPTIDSRRGGFWSYARTRLKAYNGISPRRFPLYLKELEFRYNHRGDDIFPRLVRCLCTEVPRIPA